MTRMSTPRSRRCVAKLWRKYVRRHSLCQAGRLRGGGHGVAGNLGMDRPPGSSGEQVRRGRPRETPVRPQRPKELRRQHHEAVAPTLRVAHVNHAALRVDVGCFESTRFGQAHSGAVDQRKEHTVLRRPDRAQQCDDFVRTENDGRSLPRSGPSEKGSQRRASQGASVEELERRKVLAEPLRTSSLAGEVANPTPDLFLTQSVPRAAVEPLQVADGCEIRLTGSLGVAGKFEILFHLVVQSEHACLRIVCVRCGRAHRLTLHMSHGKKFRPHRRLGGTGYDDGGVGPPRERGGEADVTSTSPRPACGASTGPPRERGGEYVSDRRRGAERPGFNGATARTRWRGEILASGCSRTRATRFNGATARTRWRVRRRRSLRTSAGGLQRGHRANAVESRDGARISRTSPTLQRGHRANAVESCMLRPRSSSRASELQRGHRANAVESARADADQLLAQCGFNGATARTRWRGGRRPRSRRCMTSVGFNGATARTRWRVASSDIAEWIGGGT